MLIAFLTSLAVDGFAKGTMVSFRSAPGKASQTRIDAFLGKTLRRS